MYSKSDFSIMIEKIHNLLFWKHTFSSILPGCKGFLPFADGRLGFAQLNEPFRITVLFLNKKHMGAIKRMIPLIKDGGQMVRTRTS